VATSPADLGRWIGRVDSHDRARIGRFAKKTLTLRKINCRPRNDWRARAALARRHVRPRSPEKTARRPRIDCEQRRGDEGG
jgi:hypothetical protein